MDNMHLTYAGNKKKKQNYDIIVHKRLISSTFCHSLGASLSIEEAIRCSGYNWKGEKPEIVWE